MSAGYGTDTWCLDEVLTGRLVSGPELVAQAIYRRLTTPRGTLRGGDEESIYGLDLLDFIGAVGTPAALDALPGLVEAEVLKDERVDSADVTATQVTGTDGLVSITLAVEAQLRDEGDSFELTLSITDTTVSVLGVTTT